MTKKEIHYLDGTSEVVDLTAEEETQRQADEAKGNEILTQEQAEIDAKVSGNQKLLDLGLTQAEATALTGYTPPVAE